ncbi:hypothetical protein F5Y12DRAFT_783548 [Xylaria sp. FL1777]|nr:hypothetical protein F5Y12DRAFT_783548 [Xylaria sp. FL1777]
MATWGGSSRVHSALLGLLYLAIGKAKIPALVANDPLLDGRIAPNDFAARNDTDTNTTTDSNSNNNTTTTAAAALVSTTATIHNNNNTNTTSYTNTSLDASGNGNGYNFAADLDYLSRTLDGPDVERAIANDTLSSRYPFPPPPNPAANDSLFATVGDPLSSHFYATPNTAGIPLLHIGGIFRGVPLVPIWQTPLSTPPTAVPTSTLQPAAAPTPASVHQNHPSSFALRECLLPRSGGYNLYGLPPNYQPQTPPNIQGSNRNPYLPTISSLPPFATLPTTLSQSHMNNVHARPTPPISQAQCFSRVTGATRSIDDQYLNALATGDFSSPSLPPLSNSPSPTSLSYPGLSSFAAAGQEMPPSSTRRRIQSRGGAVDFTKQEPDCEANSSVDPSIPLATMPATRRRSLTNVVDSIPRKRGPSAVTSPAGRPSKTRRKEPPVSRNSPSSPFEDDELPGLNGPEGSDTIDLSNATEVPAELMAPKVDNRVKIGKFQCVICMDDTTALTVTHCGHLFCSECLHSSLHIDSMKRTCPVCRTKVDLKGVKKTAKSYYHLELKLMTANKQGKRPAST